MSAKRVTLYSQPGCPPCSAAKHFLKAKNVEFANKDVSLDALALAELTGKYNSRTTPTIVVDDEVMVGFDPERLEKILTTE